jgi:hypothetical protein
MAQILFPIGRLIGGSVEKLHPRTEADGKTPKMDRDGKPMMAVNFGVAIPKGSETHWSQTAWGAEMFNIAKAAYPVLHQTPTFAWKVVDGDSAVPNKNGKLPRNQTGYAGNWVLWFSQGWAPKICSADGAIELPSGSIVPGYYVQVLGEVASNGAQPPNTPGLYMNPIAVALAGEGEKIVIDVDTTTVGFGGTLPPGAKPVQPAVSGFGTSIAPVSPPAPIVPNAAFMTPPPVRVMTAKANGATYEQMLAAGWNDDLLRQHGMMQ